MECKNKKKTKQEEQDRGPKHLRCSICGSVMKPEEYSWHEDDDGIYCLNCRAERESCGCSD